MTCLIVEDQPPAQRILTKYIQDSGSLELRATFPDALQAMEFMRTQRVDLIFLDIHLPKLSGIDFLRTLSNPPKVILTTAFPDYALESYELNVVDYLLKPYSFQRFVQAIAKLQPEQITPETGTASVYPKEIFVKSGYEHLKVVVDEILFIRSDADYTELITASRKYLSSEPLRHWLELLDPAVFTQIHKSYILNANKLVRVTSSRVYLGPKELDVPIGRAYKDDFMNRFVG